VRSNLAIPFYGAIGVLALALIVEWLPGGEPPPVPPARFHHIAATAQEGDAKDTAAWAEAINQRPLFTVGRHPPKSGHGHQHTLDTGLPRLAGIMITPWGRRAIFMPDGGKPLTLAEGASLDDDTIRQIRSDRVVLTGPKGEVILHLTYDKSRPTGLLTTTTPNFPQPGFPQGFPNPGFPNPNFPNQGFNPAPPIFPGQQPGQQPAASQSDDDNSDNAPAAPRPFMTPPFPGFRGPNIPRGRE
jgi:hypothetical protein